MGITVIHHFSGRGDHRIPFYPENPVLENYFGTANPFFFWLRELAHEKLFLGGGGSQKSIILKSELPTSGNNKQIILLSKIILKNHRDLKIIN